MNIPVIDIFAGPGGLSEGFSSFMEDGKRFFKTVLAVEKEKYAHRTLLLRLFYRQFFPLNVPKEYYSFLRGKISIDELYDLYPEEAEKAGQLAWQAKLGYDEESVSSEKVDSRIKKALAGRKDWVLLGGPPCQAYSVAGRSRKKIRFLDPATDEKVDLYRQYLRILAFHNPSVFVMENVKGMLSAKTKESPVFSRILEDLRNPVEAYVSEKGYNGEKFECPGYRIYSLVCRPDKQNDSENLLYKHNEFIICCEDYGIPQCRHRVILLGVRSDIKVLPSILSKRNPVSVSIVISDLPRIRSKISRVIDDDEAWVQTIRNMERKAFFPQIESNIADRITKILDYLVVPDNRYGAEFVEHSLVKCDYESAWFTDGQIGGSCNHQSREHMVSDLYRYLFVSCYGLEHKKSPKLSDFPKGLLPDHKNVVEALKTKSFDDRFRVHVSDQPAKTITSHISKDGHYYIHPDPSQCRSLTVREAARIQTFPDNYFFCGPRSHQYVQVGNAVPPLLARQIAGIVYELLLKVKSGQSSG